MWGRRRGLSLVNARVASATGVMSSIRIAAGRVAALGARPSRADIVVDCRGAAVLPGLVNAHDHLELDHFARLKWRERYVNVREWIADFQPRFTREPALAGPLDAPLADRLWIGGLKNLLSGVTTVCHHNPLHAPLGRGFPIRVVRRFGFSHSLGIDGEPAVAESCRRTPRRQPWIVHAAEGIDEDAAREFPTLERLGCVGPNTVLVHGVALDEGARARLAAAGGGLVWCPSSNLFLFGATVDVGDLVEAGRAALGTDSRLSGERDILAELEVARQASDLGAAALARLVLDRAADLLRLPAAGRIAVGLPADITMWPARGDDPLAALAGAVRADLLLVAVGGRPLVADPAIAAVFAASATPVSRWRLDGREKQLARDLADRVSRMSIAEPGFEPASRAPSSDGVAE